LLVRDKPSIQRLANPMGSCYAVNFSYGLHLVHYVDYYLTTDELNQPGDDAAATEVRSRQWLGVSR
jgi:hypothetical protein